MMGSPLKIAITNAVVSNTGDAAILQSIRQMLDVEFGGDRVTVVVFDADASVTRQLYPDWNIHQQLAQLPRFGPKQVFRVIQLVWIWLLRIAAACPPVVRLAARGNASSGGRIRQTLAELSSCDVVVSAGGTYLVDHYHFGVRVAELEIAKALGKPVMLWTQSMGPFASRRSKAHIRAISRVADGVSFRDDRSAAAWSGAVRRQVPSVVAPDSAFAIAVPEQLADPTRRVTAPTPAGARAVLSVRSWSRGVEQDTFDSDAYRQMMRAAAAALIELGWTTTAVSTCQGVPSYRYDDSLEARACFRGEAVEVDDDFHSPDTLMGVLARSDLVISTRMHLAILGLVLGLPVIAIGYEFKTVELFESLGLGDNVVLIEHASAEWMRDAVSRAVADPERFRLDAVQRERLRLEARRPVALMRTITE